MDGIWYHVEIGNGKLREYLGILNKYYAGNCANKSLAFPDPSKVY
jgi:hypothetical protein